MGAMKHIAIVDDEAALRENLSYALDKEDERGKMLETYEQLVRDYPDYPRRHSVLWDLVKVYTNLEQSDKAYETMQKVFAETPDAMDRYQDDPLMQKYAGFQGNRDAPGYLSFAPQLWMLTPE